ncbi:nucleotidyltransferase domain-containing protein [bacterium]|nr:nucleotidyltransferase domain-containing protein [bacterium]
MKYGMTPSQYKILENLVIQPLKDSGARVFIFGSRVTEAHHPHSDVDLLYKLSDELPPSLISDVKENIEESNFPFAVDLVNDSELASSYRESVESQLEEL